MFEGNPIEIKAIEIPSNDPWFLALIAIHILAGLTCVISGIFAMLSKKQHGLHTKAGKVYFIGIWIVFITATMVAIVRWKHDYHLFILGLVSFACALIARKAALKKWNRWSIIHISGMGFSYIFLLIAFYVDNGRFLPLWKDMNPVLYWLIPLIVGLPIIIWSLVTNPLSRGYFKKTNPKI